MLKNTKNNSCIEWLTPGKAVWRFMTASFKKRDFFRNLFLNGSPQCTSLELFVEKLYANIRDVHNAKIINLIEHYKNIA